MEENKIQKSTNLIYCEVKNELGSSINNALNTLPVSMVETMMELFLSDIRMLSRQTYEKDMKEYEEELEKQKEIKKDTKK